VFPSPPTISHRTMNAGAISQHAVDDATAPSPAPAGIAAGGAPR
jgi:hypothetical protein